MRAAVCGHPVTAPREMSGGFQPASLARSLRQFCNVIWFFEREQDLVVCEVRKTEDETAYEFEVAPSNAPPAVQHFDSPHDLIEAYLKEQKRLLAEGWHPTTALDAE